MTTICFDGKSMASERRATWGSLIMSGPSKIMRAPDGRLIGCAGDAAWCNAMTIWLSKPKEKRGDAPELEEDDGSVALEVQLDGSVVMHCASGFFGIEAPCSIGTGSHFAIAAMACGKDARGAVEIACRFDKNSGGQIDVLHLKKK